MDNVIFPKYLIVGTVPGTFGLEARISAADKLDANIKMGKLISLNRTIQFRIYRLVES